MAVLQKVRQQSWHRVVSPTCQCRLLSSPARTRVTIPARMISRSYQLGGESSISAPEFLLHSMCSTTSEHARKRCLLASRQGQKVQQAFHSWSLPCCSNAGMLDANEKQQKGPYTWSLFVNSNAET